MSEFNLKNIKCMIFDLDGTIYFGSSLADKANEVIQKARESYRHIFFVTNNSAKTRTQIFEKLKSLGINLTLDELYTTSYIIPKYLQLHNYKEIYCIGTDDLKAEIKNTGINPNSKTPQAIVAGFNPDFKLHDLDELANIKLPKDCKLLIANVEKSYPVDNGYLNAGAGPIVGALEYLLNKKYDVMIGKPNTTVISTVVDGLNIKSEEIAVIGDRYDSDVKMAKDYNAIPVLITKDKKNDCICIEKLADLMEIM